MTESVDINDAQFDALVLKSAVPVLLECASPECIICKTMAERIAEASKDFLNKVVFFRLNVNENKRWHEFNVRVIPTILYFKNGVLVARQESFPETEELRSQIRAIIGKGDYALNIYSEFKTAIDYEDISAKFYNYVCANIKHGKTRERFKIIHQESLKHRDLLHVKFKELTDEDYLPEASQKFEGLDMKPQGFSMLGALKMSLRIEEKLLSFYKKLKSDKLMPEKALFKRLIKEETNHLKQLQKEMKFMQDKELFSSMDSSGYPAWLNKVFE